MMSGLMMVFLLIAVAFMLDVQASKNEIERQKNDMAEIALMAERSRLQLNKELLAEFDRDLKQWNAEILKDNTVRFKSPQVLFESGKSTLRSRFKMILNHFFHRYINILQRYKLDIEAIRIEGHTSSDWRNTNDLTTRYLNNVELSQQRALATLKYCYLRLTEKQQVWLRKVLRANGLSFAKPILTQGKEDMEKSRRVEFKVVTKAEKKLYQILERSRLK
jgi:outer membrane protein OmpA-like peptidoglycan-associated protein